MPYEPEINSVGLNIKRQALDLPVVMHKRGLHNSFVNERFGLLVARVAPLKFQTAELRSVRCASSLLEL